MLCFCFVCRLIIVFGMINSLLGSVSGWYGLNLVSNSVSELGLRPRPDTESLTKSNPYHPQPHLITYSIHNHWWETQLLFFTFHAEICFFLIFCFSPNQSHFPKTTAGVSESIIWNHTYLGYFCQDWVVTTSTIWEVVKTRFKTCRTARPPAAHFDLLWLFDNFTWREIHTLSDINMIIGLYLLIVGSLTLLSTFIGV